MGSLNDIAVVNISRETQAISRASFGTPAVIAEFATSKTTPAFVRHRFYESLEEMIADGWLVTDPCYLAVKSILSQNPKVTKVMVGRKDLADTSFEEALNLILADSGDWYAYCIIPNAGTEEADLKSSASWAETQPRLYFWAYDDADIYDALKTTDLASFFHGKAYDRTVGIWHKELTEFLEAGWMGECLPYDPGSQTWAFKTIAGSSPDKLSSSQRGAILAKKCNTYTTTAGVNITEEGVVASGEFIDVIRGVDWLHASLQEAIFENLVNKRKIPYDDSGITLIAGLVQSVLEEAVRMGILQENSILVTAPLYADISSANKLARILPDIKFTALLQGAIHKVLVNGTVTV
jgi:hypothetical protein